MRVDSIPGEITKPAEECGMPREIAYPAPEYPAMVPETPAVSPEYDTGGRQAQMRRGNTPRNGRFESEEAMRTAEEAEREAKRRRRVRKQLLRTFAAPVAATVAVIAVVFASFGYDPLGGSTGTGLYADAEPGSPGSDPDTKKPTGSAAMPTEGAATPSVVIATPTLIANPTPTPKLYYGSEDSHSEAIPVTWTMAHVEAPNGAVYDTPLTEDDPTSYVLEWVSSWGGSSNLTQTDKKRVFLGYKLSDDALFVGDIDDFSNIYIVSGTIYAVYREDVYYKAEFASGTPVASPTPTPAVPVIDTSFPTLPNQDPDTEGNYAWNPNGDPEQFICIHASDGSYYYPVSGSGIGAPISDAPGTEYDSATNTLTLTDCTLIEMEINLMGNSFTIKLVGDNHVGQIRMWGAMYAGSVTLTGTGTLTLNEDRNFPIGLVLDAEVSPSALLVDRGIQVDVYGDVAIIIGATTLEKAIYCRTGVVMTGGECRSGEYSQYLTQYVTLANQYSGYSEPLYDYAVVDDSGVPVSEVHFTDPDR